MLFNLCVGGDVCYKSYAFIFLFTNYFLTLAFLSGFGFGSANT